MTIVRRAVCGAGQSEDLPDQENEAMKLKGSEWIGITQCHERRARTLLRSG
jgi:hypothetical protein